MDTIDLASVSVASGRPMQLVLGYELFESCVVRFDDAGGVMDVWESGRAPRDLPGVAVTMTLEENHPYVEGTLTVPGRAPLRGKFVIDTGSTAVIIAAFTRDARGLVVRWISPETPAAEAGLHGDQVIHFDGEPAERVDPPAMRSLLQQDGHVVTFGVLRGADSLTVRVKLRRLL